MRAGLRGLLGHDKAFSRNYPYCESDRASDDNAQGKSVVYSFSSYHFPWPFEVDGSRLGFFAVLSRSRQTVNNSNRSLTRRLRELMDETASFTIVSSISNNVAGKVFENLPSKKLLL